MIDHELSKAIFLLSQTGISIRQLGQRFKISRNTVRKIIRGNGGEVKRNYRNKIIIDPDLLADLYDKCNGYMERMHELLIKQGVNASYSTITRRVRMLGLSLPESRCDYVDDEPGKEMQHDTSPYQIMIGEKRTKVVVSLIYLRYSKRRYLRFYRNFTRFRMKCFLYEALAHFGFAARYCIIDNTNLAVESGTGKNALICLEMLRFAEQFGYEFQAHEIRHSNRKAGNERSFWTVETNFFPGREFSSLEDLNTQAIEWATVTMENRPLTKKKIIPAEMFLKEIPYLKKIWPHLPKPYLTHDRKTDQYGYIAFDSNYFYVPGTSRHPVKVLEYDNSLAIYHQREKIAEYALPADGTHNKRFPERSGVSSFPNNQKEPVKAEEEELRRLGTEVSDYIDFVYKTKGIKRFSFIRKLHVLSRRGNLDIFKKAILRASKHHVAEIGAIERIYVYLQNAQGLEITDLDIDEDYTKRKTYHEGLFGDKPDLSQYQKLFESENDNE